MVLFREWWPWAWELWIILLAISRKGGLHAGMRGVCLTHRHPIIALPPSQRAALYHRHRVLPTRCLLRFGFRVLKSDRGCLICREASFDNSNITTNDCDPDIKAFQGGRSAPWVYRTTETLAQGVAHIMAGCDDDAIIPVPFC